MQVGRVLRVLLSGEPQNSKLPPKPNSPGRQKSILGQLLSAAEVHPKDSTEPLWRVAALEAELGKSMTRMQRSS